MAEKHDSLVKAFRMRLFRKGFRLAKSPTPTYRPDVFAERYGRNDQLIEQTIVEAEIDSTLFSEHTSHQLVLLNEYLEHQKRKGVKVRGYLLIPSGKQVLTLANSLIDSLFPKGSDIRVLQNG
jgi:hypothetical protein